MVSAGFCGISAGLGVDSAGLGVVSAVLFGVVLFDVFCDDKSKLCNNTNSHNIPDGEKEFSLRYLVNI